MNKLVSYVLPKIAGSVVGDSSYPEATPTPRKAVKGAKEASVRPAEPPYLASRLWTSGGSW